MKLAYLFMFLSAGAPNIYYGDEVGMTGEQDPDNRRCMLWDKKDQDLDFYHFTKQLITLREKHPSFSDYDYHFIETDLLMFEKIKDDDHILVIINHGNATKTSIPNSLRGNYIDLISNKKVTLHDTINLEEYSFLTLHKEN
jgi:cyclomaltodextrinase / maltogenic alpha-amylase / neopullulanase